MTGDYRIHTRVVLFTNSATVVTARYRPLQKFRGTRWKTVDGNTKKMREGAYHTLRDARKLLGNSLDVARMQFSALQLPQGRLDPHSRLGLANSRTRTRARAHSGNFLPAIIL